jgi:hypothetical protein
MKSIGNHYEDIIIKTKQFENAKVMTILKKLPTDIKNLKNLIFYGANGIGKYSHMLTAIKQYSPSELKYEKKINVIYDKEPYYFKISDIHYEIDFSLLGCNSKQLWHEIYTHIVDIIYSKPVKNGIIVCKYFNEIQPELLENFYSYMQKNVNHSLIDIKFMLLCEHISFLPENILNCCEIVHFSKPKTSSNTNNTNNKSLYSFQHYDIVSNKIYGEMVDIKSLNFLKFRESIYDIFSYNLSINICVWKLMELITKHQKITDPAIFSSIMLKIYSFLKFYQNNYRPISHVEYFLYYLINVIIK